MKPFDVTCPRCGETGSKQRMDIKGVCFYCREELAEARKQRGTQARKETP